MAAFGVGVLLLAGCTPVIPLEQKIMMNGQYWQRVDTTDMIYQRGPKAQQMLMRDIGRCTSELNELERQGLLRKAVPRIDPAEVNAYPDANDSDFPKQPTPYQQALADWETPDRDGYLLNEPQEYEDFDGCMYAKGWDRTKYVPYETAYKARENYLDTLQMQQARTKSGDRRPAGPHAHRVEDRSTGGDTKSNQNQAGGGLNPS
jgi:hypothetical protein